MVAYIDFENKALTDECLDPDNKKMFAVLYVTIFAFHPDDDVRGLPPHPQAPVHSPIYSATIRHCSITSLARSPTVTSYQTVIGYFLCTIRHLHYVICRASFVMPTGQYTYFEARFQ